jgi:hypothetical protein
MTNKFKFCFKKEKQKCMLKKLFKLVDDYKQMVMYIPGGWKSSDSIYKCHSGDGRDIIIARDLSNPFEFISRAGGRVYIGSLRFR